MVAPGRCRAAAALLGVRRVLPGLVLSDALLEILEPELQLVRVELLRSAAELLPQQARDQQPQLVVLGMQRAVLLHGIPQHLPQDGGIIGQRVEVDLHAPMMPNAAAPDLQFPAQSQRCYPASSGLRRGTGARHSQPSSSAANCGVDKAMQPVVVVVGQANCPCSSFFVSRHRPTPSCQSSLISPARRPRKAKTAPLNGSSARPCCTSIARPTIPLRMSVTPQAR